MKDDRHLGSGVVVILMAVALSVFAGRPGTARRAKQPGEKHPTEPQRPGNH